MVLVEERPSVAGEPLITVVMPAFNYAELLPRALDSVVSQRADDIEIIVVDDGSTDHTSNVLSSYASKFPDVFKFVCQKNSGPAAARNNGIQLSRGRYVLCLDADDELIPGAIEKFRKAVQSNPAAGLVLGGYVAVSNDGHERRRIPRKVSGNCRNLMKDYLLTKRITISPGSVLFRKDLLLQRLYPEQLRGCEDLPVFAYMLAVSEIMLVNDCLVKNYRHDESLRNRRDDQEGMVDVLVEETFAMLPSDCQDLRDRFKAQRYLSLFRSACLLRDKDSALRLYRQAFSSNPWQSLQWGYLRKLLYMLFV